MRTHNHFQYNKERKTKKKKKKNTLNYPKSAAMGFTKRLKNEFETAVVNEPSVFEPLKVYCISKNKSSAWFNFYCSPENASQQAP